MRDMSFNDYLIAEYQWKEKQRRTNITIQGARIELINMLNDKNLPLYYEPSLKKVIETIEQEYDVLNKIRAEIKEEIESYRMADWETNNILADGLQMALNIIDGYREGEQDEADN